MDIYDIMSLISMIGIVQKGKNMLQNPFEIHLYDQFRATEQLQSNYLLIYTIKGTVIVTSAERRVILRSDEYCVINPHEVYRLMLQDRALMVLIIIDSEVFTNLTNQSYVYFQCISTENSSVKYDKFRYIIGELLSELAISPTGMDCAKMSALYKICEYLVKFFLVSKNTALPYRGKKLHAVLDYVDQHYREKLTLHSVADEIYMTPSSFSRMFSKETGTSFIEYLNHIRLEHAAKELEISNGTVSDIAFHNGFGSIPQFNKLFKRKFGVSPREYKNQAKQMLEFPEEEHEAEIFHTLENYQLKTRHVVVREQKIHLQSVEVDSEKGIRMENPWGNFINLGFASKIMSAEYQKQILFLKETLNFESGIINGLFSPEMKLMESGSSRLNFIKLDQVLDFLISIKIKPFIVLDNQILNMLKALNSREGIACISVASSLSEGQKIIETIMDHLIYRYGSQEVEGWHISLWYDGLNKTTLGICQPFYLVWDCVYETIRKKLPTVQIGGCGYGMSEKQEDLIAFYSEWKQSVYRPDFLAINCFPYRRSEVVDKLHAVRRKIDNFFIEDLDEFQRLLREVRFPETPVVASEWNLSFIQRNAFNDMSGKAAIMMKQMIHSVNEVSQVAYWPLSDLYAEDYDADQLLNGACGLTSTNGICKPVFYAMSFFRSLYRILVDRGEHYIITKDDMGHFCMILCNQKQLNHNYYAKAESEIVFSDAERIFENSDSLELSITLKNLPEREYSMRIQKISPSSGSALDEWFRLGRDVPLTAGDISYLKRKSIPDRKSEHLNVINHSLTIQERLEVHEMVLIQLI